MLNTTDCKTILDTFDSVKQRHHRLFIHVANDQVTGLKIINHLLSLVNFDDILWVDKSLNDPGKQLRAKLGTEVDALIINAFDGLNPNVLGITSGLVRAGGVCILLTPRIDDWPDFDDPDYQRMQSGLYQDQSVQKRFIRHFIDTENQFKKVFIKIDHIGVHLNDIDRSEPIAIDFTKQNQLIKRIQKVMTGHSKRPLVIEADRGRGKSAALGIAAANLLVSNKRNIHIGVCSISRQSVESLFHHASKTLNYNHRAGEKALSFKSSLITYFSIDKLIKEKPKLDLLIVDEAAALPVFLLVELLREYNRLVFSTTLNGYEGNGNGFAIRFTKRLTKMMPLWRRFILEQPIRFAQNDPLESFINDVLLLKVNSEPKNVLIGEFTFQWIHQDELLSKKDVLKDIFGLLISAHYQTSPDDLRMMLDHPGIKIAIAMMGSHIVGVALLIKEGGFTTTEKQDILLKNRRYRGHIVPQMLKSQGMIDALDDTFQRIMRIAVLPACQRMGVGSRLLSFIQNALNGADYLSVCFSCEPDVLSFWQQNGFKVVRLGTNKSASTGLYSACLLKPLKESARKKSTEWLKFYSESISYQLLTQNHDLLATVVEMILLDTYCTHHRLDKQCAIDYGAGRVGFESVLPSLYRLYQYAITSATGLPTNNEERYLLTDKLILNHSWHDISSRYQLSGRKKVEEIMRKYFKEFCQSHVG